MINDSYKDLIYLADSLAKKHPKLFKKLCDIFSSQKIKFDIIPNTKDIWARDYMPLQNAAGAFIQFIYKPDYLKAKSCKPLITNVTKSTKDLKIETIKSKIVLDGGNVVHYGSKVIMCDKILKENPSYDKEELINELKKLLRVNHVILIPTQVSDIFGHADGVLRFKNANTVLINDYSKDDPKYWKQLLSVLIEHKLKAVKIPCASSENKSNMDATGFYINYLQMKNHIFIPSFNKTEDKLAESILKKEFPKHQIIPIDCRAIAKSGGLLNCITWTTKSNHQTKESNYEKEVKRDILNLELEELYLDFNKPSPYPEKFLKKLNKNIENRLKNRKKENN